MRAGLLACVLPGFMAIGSAARAQEQLPWGKAESPRVITPGDGKTGAAPRSKLGGDAQDGDDGPTSAPSREPGRSYAQQSPNSGYGGERPYDPRAQDHGSGYPRSNAERADDGQPYGDRPAGDERGDEQRPNDRRAGDPRPYGPGETRPYENGPGYGGPSYGRPYEQAPPPYARGGPDRGEPYRGPAYSRDDSPDQTYSPGEINSAGHRFFGKITSGLASVIEYSFQRGGRPTGYILGEEGGGAFVAGLRYGEGTLHLKDGTRQKVYWQGPSIGYDFGAEASKTMILVYNIYNPSDIYATFGGVDGSAYLVGGVGITFQKNHDLVLAPIRSGLGLRLGANVGYLKYTRSPTWNPF